jgi:hypothetical protein
MSPHFAFAGGSYSLDNHYWEPFGPPPAANLPNAAEAQRQAASQAQPNQRFHYRAVAADLLPARSQAFAASLCQASSCLIDTDYAGAREQRWHYRTIVLGEAFTRYRWALLAALGVLALGLYRRI